MYRRTHPTTLGAQKEQEANQHIHLQAISCGTLPRQGLCKLWKVRRLSRIRWCYHPRMVVLSLVCAVHSLGNCRPSAMVPAVMFTVLKASACVILSGPPTSRTWQVFHPYFSRWKSSQMSSLHQHCPWPISSSPGALGHGLGISLFKVPEINWRWCDSLPEWGFHSRAHAMYNA